ncbi:MAG: hypothetical protein QF593_00325 [Nitrospinota bacterium]|nr:hypothetical protein [Nitrospinota bacterium]
MKHGQGLLVAAVVALSLALLALLVALAVAFGWPAPGPAPSRAPGRPQGSPAPPGPPRETKKGVCVFDLDGTLLGAPGAKPQDRIASVCTDAGFDVAVVTAGGTGPQRAKDAGTALGLSPADFKFFTATHGLEKGEVIAGQLARCYPPSQLPPRVVLFDDNPDFSKSARDWGFCSSSEQSAAIRANAGVDPQIVREGIAACAPWRALKTASPSSLTGATCRKEIS